MTSELPSLCKDASNIVRADMAMESKKKVNSK